MPAAVWKIIIEQGSTWRTVLRLKDATGPLDLTGFTARMQVRESMTSPQPLISLSDGDGITVDGPSGTLTLLIPDEFTALLGWEYGLYDLEIESPNGETTRILKGEVLVSREVTR